MNLSRGQFAIVASLTVVFATSMPVKGSSGSNNSRRTSGVSSSQLAVGDLFLAARSRVIREGWKPVRMHSEDNYEYSGAERKAVDHGFLEVDSCSIDAGANCIFYYRKATKCLRVDTVGEQVAEMKVTRWTNECPIGQP
jgi:hypothetical protein